MKKFFAIVFIAMAMCFGTVVPSAYAQNIEKEEEVQHEDKITMEFLNQQSSWDELLANMPQIGSEGSDSDLICETLIFKLASSQWMVHADNAYHFKYVINGSLGSEERKLDEQRFKYDKIVELYNASNSPKAYLHYNAIGNQYQVLLYSYPYWITYTRPGKVGEAVFVRTGARYWQSCKNDGSGDYGVITPDNSGVFTINGIAYLDDERSTVVSKYYAPYGEKLDVEIQYDKPLMLHICTPDTDYGWVYADDVISEPAARDYLARHEEPDDHPFIEFFEDFR